MAKNSILMLIVIAITTVTLTVLTPTMNGTPLQITSILAQEETEASGDLTGPGDNMPFGGDNAGTYSIGQ
ncbi:MAG: hypothetical protein ACRD8W_06665, partial [Nitrososphaeraceae archaeon]